MLVVLQAKLYNGLASQDDLPPGTPEDVIFFAVTEIALIKET